jgi:hypothetical protein
VLLVGEGLDDADAADILLDAGVEIADAAEEPASCASSARRSALTSQVMSGTISAVISASWRVHREHQREGADEGHDGDEQVLRAVMGDLADLLQVLGDAGDQMAGLLLS